MIRTPMTVQGEIRLREELQNLKKNERPKIVREIAEARAHGDLSENAEYHAAKEQQGLIEARIALLEEKLSSAQIIDTQSLNAGGKIVFGATVELMNLATNEEVSYQIVGEMEADIKNGLVSITSPLARALIGREEGDVTTVQAPSGEVKYEVLTVRYL
uniref:Transcription elongation factor GreA n=1 Tax=Candidatus Kentrum sp. FW TaxID=2126338 RepID=A0A450TVI1_9GAMM|nr:MAG: transcription elongation factor GreA [Candidatus Kentron sp. FW]